MTLSLNVGHASGGAFDIGLGDAVRAWGFGPQAVDLQGVRDAMGRQRRPAHAALVGIDGEMRATGLPPDGRPWSVAVEAPDHARGAPLLSSPASVTVVARGCAEADAWATALMVAGPDAGAALAARQGLSALFGMRDEGGGIRARGCGSLFAEQTGTPPLGIADHRVLGRPRKPAFRCGAE